MLVSPLSPVINQGAVSLAWSRSITSAHHVITCMLIGLGVSAARGRMSEGGFLFLTHTQMAVIRGGGSVCDSRDGVGGWSEG